MQVRIKETRRVITVAGRMTEAERDRVTARAEALGMKPAEWVRRVILQALDAGPEPLFVVSQIGVLQALLVETTKAQGLDVKAVIEAADKGCVAFAERRWEAFTARAIGAGAA